MSIYELKLEKFSGPIEKLLELIEERKLEITELSLAEVTADFLSYLEKIKDIELEEGFNENSHEVENIASRLVQKGSRLLADFIVIASQLLLIKSKALLPTLCLTEEEERDIKDLENRLRFYQQFKPAINYLKKLSEQNNISVSRPLFWGRPTFFYPAENVKIEELYKEISRIFEFFRKSSESQVIKSSLISLEEKIQEIINRLRANEQEGVNIGSGGIKVGFNELTEGRSRSEIIISFLALLHLLADQLIKVEQKNKFSDIIITEFKQVHK